MSKTTILVAVKPPTAAGRLYPRYDEESGILAVESRVERVWPHGVDVDGAMVFDLDASRVLANFDLLVPRSRWSRDLEGHVPVIAPAGDIEFSQDTIAEKSFHLPLRLRSDRKLKRVRIELGSGKPDRAVALSKSCIAFLSDRELAGFLVELE